MSKTEDCRAKAEAAEAKASIARDDIIIRNTYLELAYAWRQMAAKFERIEQRREERRRPMPNAR